HDVLLLLLHMRRTPTRTFFPYTTLFRSKTMVVTPSFAAQRGRSRQVARPPSREYRDDVRDDQRDAKREADARERHRGIPRTAGEDRKSTRLNSSHVKISYAVFCLKKKKR